MKILQICHRIPYPPIDGGNIVMMNTALGLADAGNEVHQFALNTNKHYIDPEKIPAALRSKLHFDASFINTKVTIPGMMKNLFSDESYNVVRFFSDDVRKKLENILRAVNFEVIQLETLFTAPYIEFIRKNSDAKIVLRAHNVEHIIWERLASKESNPLKKQYLRFLARRLKKFEQETLKEVDALVPITHVDESTFRKMHFTRPTITVPMCLDIKDYAFDSEMKIPLSLFHLGSMDWMPNVEAVDWFLKNCWGKIHLQFPDLKLFLAGRSFPKDIVEAGYPNVICEDRIEDAHAYMADKQIMIVPLHSGSGMRVKIVQGLALGKTIISTSIGAEGIPVKHEDNILIADTPEDFMTLVSRCMENPEWCRQIGNRGRLFAEENYSNAVAGRLLTVFYKALLKI